MQLILDNHTQTLIQVAISFMLFTVMFTEYWTRDTYPGFSDWTISKIPNVVGWLLISLNGGVSVWVMVAGNILVAVTQVLNYSGIRKFRGRPASNRLNLVLLFLLMAGDLYFTAVKSSANARMLLVFLFGAYIMARCGFELMFDVPKELRLSYWFTASMFFLTTLIGLVRVVTFLYLPQLYSIFGIDQMQNLVFLAANILGIGWTFGFFMMTNQRLVIDLQASEKQQRLLASTDYLTGAYNRAAFVERSEALMALARRHSHPLVALIIDVDHFKHVNDQYGHPAGDEVLRSFAAACQAQLRKSDLLARWGGEEFAILLPETGAADCEQMAERLREAIAGLSVETSSGPIQVTVSIGCALRQLETRDIFQLVARADQALYQAKQSGRNRVVMFEYTATKEDSPSSESVLFQPNLAEA